MMVKMTMMMSMTILTLNPNLNPYSLNMTFDLPFQLLGPASKLV